MASRTTLVREEIRGRVYCVRPADLAEPWWIVFGQSIIAELRFLERSEKLTVFRVSLVGDEQEAMGRLRTFCNIREEIPVDFALVCSRTMRAVVDRNLISHLSQDGSVIGFYFMFDSPLLVTLCADFRDYLWVKRRSDV